MNSDTVARMRESRKKVAAIAHAAAALFLKNLCAAGRTPSVRQASTEHYALAAGVMTAAANTAQRRTS